MTATSPIPRTERLHPDLSWATIPRTHLAYLTKQWGVAVVYGHMKQRRPAWVGGGGGGRAFEDKLQLRHK